ncbi:MAG TPA: 3-phosphoserine/phosphohydroxythreonine transaminase [Chitinophagales bacterium]|nr:3-phosphoserine/phosphohydroxythreonine transaminase [Chitinophagales bacterium]
MKKYNFYSGPAILPQEVFQQASKAVIELDNIGLSLIEISHRSKEFVAVVEEAQSLVREITGLDDEYKILFLQGGATMQFCQVPYNMLNENETAAYMEIGSWSKKAIKEAKLFGNVNVVASSADKDFTYIPKNFSVPSDAKYFHITTNETIHGVQMQQIPDSPVPLIADMSSDIFSRPLDWKKFDMIYGGAQKNIGPAGATLVILKESLLGKVKRPIPTMLDYRSHIKDNSLHNTPCTFSIYVCMITLRWLKAQGGLVAVEKNNREKASSLYAALDASELFIGNVAKEDRSLMNITWVLKKPELEDAFNNFAKENGCIGIKGHRSVGGFRASIYNAMSLEGVNVLIDVMKEFERKNG